MTSAPSALDRLPGFENRSGRVSQVTDIPFASHVMGIWKPLQIEKGKDAPSLTNSRRTILAWSEDPVFAPLIAQAMKKLDPKKTSLTSVDACNFVIREVNQKIDENLVLFFLKLRSSISERDLPEALLGDTQITAGAIRDWMRSNKGVLQRITRFRLDHADCSMIPPEIGLLTELRELHLDGNKFTALPIQMRMLVHLQRLDLDRNAFAVFPKVIGHFSELQYLSIAFNDLTVIDGGIKNLTALEELYLYSNKNLSSLPTEIGQLKGLKKLAICYCNFSEFPSEILPLTKLELLDMSYNKLAGPLKGIEGFPRLNHLLLTGNPEALFAKLPEKIAKLARQEQFRLDIEDDPLYRFYGGFY